MRIVLSNDTYYPHVNGSSYFTQRLAFYLKKAGHDVMVIAPSRKTRSEIFFHEGIPVLGVTSIPVLIQKNFRFSPSVFIKSKIKRALKEFKPDLVHIQGHFFLCRTVAQAARNLDIPVMGTNHFMPENLVHFLHLPKKPEDMLKKLAWKDFKRIFNKLKIVTTPTKAAAKLLSDNGFTKSVFPISCGIDMERFNTQKTGDVLRKKFDIPHKPALLYIGRLDKEKNVDILLESFAQVVKKIDAMFVIGGTGAEKENLQNIARDLRISKNVRFLGFVPDKELPEFYHLGDCFVIAGTAELQSIVTLEAMASGLPVIAVNAVALPELIKHGQNGYLFDINSTKYLAKYMYNILSNKKLRKKMSEESLKIIKKHDIKNTVKHFEKLYKKLIKKSS